MKKCSYCDEIINESCTQCPHCGGECKEETIQLEKPDKSPEIDFEINEHIEDNKKDEQPPMAIKIFRIVIWATIAFTVLSWICGAFKLFQMLEML